MKKSLSITDEQKYGKSSPINSLPSDPKKKSKSAPTITLYGPQVDAFCGDGGLKVGTSGSATVHFVVKAVSLGSEYGNDAISGDSKKQVTLSLSHVECEDSDAADGDEDDDSDAEGDEDEDDGADEPATPEPETAASKKPVSVSDTALDDL